MGRRNIGAPNCNGEKGMIMADEQVAHNDGAQTFELADDSLIEVTGGVEIPTGLPTAARKREVPFLRHVLLFRKRP